MRKKLILVLAVLTVVTISGGWQQQSGKQNSERPTRFTGSRMDWQGDVWLSWLSPVRTWFVETAMAGYREGYGRGCRDAIKNMGAEPGGQKQASEVCPNNNLFKNQALAYSSQMTDFYTRYPKDRDLPIAYLARMIITSKPQTLEEIHQWIKHIPSANE